MVVDSKPGGNTIIGTDLLAKAPPDGYTIGLITDSLTINPMFFDKLPYESEKDFDGFPARIASGVKAITTN